MNIDLIIDLLKHAQRDALFARAHFDAYVDDYRDKVMHQEGVERHLSNISHLVTEAIRHLKEDAE